MTIRDLQQVPGSSPDLNGVTAWASIEGSSDFYLVWGSRGGQLTLAQFNGPFGETVIRQRFRDARFTGHKPYKMRYFVENRFLWLIVAYSDPEKPISSSIVVYQVNGTLFVPKQLIRADGADIDVIQDRGSVYLAISDDSKVRMFAWYETQFDEVAERPMPGVLSIKILRISSDIYIATAQIDSSTPFKSQLLLYKPLTKKTGELMSHQVLETKYKYEKVNFFTVAGNAYIVYSGTEAATIFWWVGDGFLEYQALDNSQGAIDVFPMRLIDGEILLTFMFNRKITFYTQSTNSRFTEVYNKEFPSDIQLSGIHLASYTNKYLYAFIAFEQPVPSLKPMSPVWKIRLVPYYQIHDSEKQDGLTQCLSQLGTDLMARDARLRELNQKANRVWVKSPRSQPQVITAPVIVEGSVVVNGVANFRSMVITTDSAAVPQVTNTQIKNRIVELEKTTKHVQSELPRLARKDKSNVIAGKITFASVVSANKIRIRRISNENVVINGLAFHDLQNNVLRTDQDQVISGKWTFAAGLKAEKIYIGGRLNGIRLNDVLLKHSNTTQVVTGKLTFRNLTIDSSTSLPPAGTINGIYLSDIVTRNSDQVQVIGGVKRMSKVEVLNNVNVHGLTNNKDLTAFAQKAVKLNAPEPQVLRGSIALEAESTDMDSLDVMGLINNMVNITHLTSFAVLKSKPAQLISGRKTFHSAVSVIGNVDVAGRINGIDFDKELVTINRPQEIVVPLVFKSVVKFSGNVETMTVNGIDLSTEAVLRNSPIPQVITSRKGFMKGITVKGDITMDELSTIDDVDPSVLQKNIMSRNNITLYGPLFFDNVQVLGNVVAHQGINGHMISDLPNIVWLKSANQTISRPVTFLSPISVDRVTTSAVNSLRIPDDFVLRSSPTDQVVTGEKIFLDDVSLPSVGLTANPGVLLNGVDLNQFNQEMVRNLKTKGLDPIAGSKIFNEIIVKGNIYATRINGLDLKRDVMINSIPQTVLSPVVLLAPSSEVQERLYVQGNIDVKETTNGIKLKDWAENVVRIKNPSRPIRNKQFLSLHADFVSAEGTISGINLNEFKAKVVTLDGDHLITAPKKFFGKLTFENQLTVDRLNGLDITEYEKRVVRRDRPAAVTGKKVIHGRLILNNRHLQVTGLVGGVNLTRMVRDAFSRSRNNVVSSKITFLSNVRMPELVVNSKIDGVHMDELIYLNENSSVESNVIFENDITVEGQLLSEKGIINGCDLRKLSAEAIPLDVASVTVSGRKTFTSLEVERDLNVSGSVNGIKIPLLADSVVTLDSTQVIQGPVKFLDTVTVDNLYISAPVSGVDVIFLLKDAVSKTRPQTITGMKIFMTDLRVSGPALFARDMQVSGLVNGVNLTLLNQTLVSKYANQAIHGVKTFTSQQDIIFERDVTVGGLIGSGANLVKVPDDLVLLKGNAHIPGEVTFANSTHVRRNLNVKGSIDGVYLPDISSRRISLAQDQRTSGDMVFRDPITVDRLIVRKTINGIPVDEIVTKTGNHVLKGNYQVMGKLSARRNLILGPGAHINGISVEEIAKRAIDSRVGGRVTGSVYVTSEAELGQQGLDTRLLNGISVRSLVSDYANYSSLVNRKMNEFRTRINDHGSKLRSQLSRIDSQSTSLSFFDVVYEFPQDSKGANVRIKKFVPIPNQLNTFGNSSAHVLYPISDRFIYWRERGKYVNDDSCPVYGSVFQEREADNKYREHDLPIEGTRPMFVVYGLKFVSPFLLWLNDTECSGGLQVLATASIQSLNSQLTPAPVFEFVPITSSYIVDIRTFTYAMDDYLIVGFGDRRAPSKAGTVVFTFNQKRGVWLIHQQLKSYAVSALDMISLGDGKDRTIHLVLANRLTVVGTPAPSTLLVWDGSRRQFVQSQVLNTWSPSAVQFMTDGDAFTPQVFLVVANEKAKLYGGDCDSINSEFGDPYSSYFTQHVNVYQLMKGNHWEIIQSLNMPGVTSIDHIHLPPSGLILLTGSRSLGRTSVHLLRGVNLFQEMQSFSTPAVTDIKSFWSSDGQLFVGIGSSDSGQSKIMKGVLAGPPPRLRPSSPFA